MIHPITGTKLRCMGHGAGDYQRPNGVLVGSKTLELVDWLAAPRLLPDHLPELFLSASTRHVSRAQ
jgi:hypothetical protein